jgi:FlaA1/EpsC-like NDP-sugar epimerase
MYRKKSQIGQLVVCMIDLVLILGVAVFSGMLRYGFSFSLFRKQENVALLLATLSILHVLLFFVMNIYGTLYKRSRYQELLLTALYNLILVAISLFIGFTMKEDVFVSRLMMGYFFLIDTVLQCLLHIFIRNRRRIFKTGAGAKRGVMLFTEAEYVSEIIGELKHQKEAVWDVIGVVLPEGSPSEPGEEWQDVPVF